MIYGFGIATLTLLREKPVYKLQSGQHSSQINMNKYATLCHTDNMFFDSQFVFRYIVMLFNKLFDMISK